MPPEFRRLYLPLSHVLTSLCDCAEPVSAAIRVDVSVFWARMAHALRHRLCDERSVEVDRETEIVTLAVCMCVTAVPPSVQAAHHASVLP